MEPRNTKVALTYDDLQLLEDECARLTDEAEGFLRKAAEATKRRDEIASDITAVRALLSRLAPLRDGQATAELAERPTTHEQPAQQRQVRGGATWMTEIARNISGEKEGVTYEGLRAGIESGPLSNRLKESDKGMYGGVGKLEAVGELVKHRGRLFSPAMFDDFRRRVASGEIGDIPEIEASTRHSPMADAILAFLAKHPEGVPSGDIVEELKRYSEFVGPVSKNRTAAYNVIKRLETRGQLIKEGKLHFLPKNSKALTGQPESASRETGGAATP